MPPYPTLGFPQLPLPLTRLEGRGLGNSIGQPLEPLRTPEAHNPTGGTEVLRAAIEAHHNMFI